MTELRPIRITNEKIVHNWSECQRIVQVLGDRGMSATLEQAFLLWEWVSAVEFSASWIGAEGMTDEEVFEFIEPHIEAQIEPV